MALASTNPVGYFLRKRINWPRKCIFRYYENAWKSAQKRMEKVYENASIL